MNTQRDNAGCFAPLLPEDDVVQIRESHANGETQSSIANRFGLVQSHVSQIVLGKIYRNVGGPIKKLRFPRVSVVQRRHFVQKHREHQRENVEWKGKYGPMSEKDAARILSKIDGDIFGDECAFWTASGANRGKGAQHGRTTIRHPDGLYGTNTVFAHRLLFHNYKEALCDEKPEILHACDHDGRCCCLKHLRAGTSKENTADCIKDGNQNFPNSFKISDEAVVEIRESYANGQSVCSIAKRSGCHESTVRKIVNGKTYSNVGGPIKKPRLSLSDDNVREIRRRCGEGETHQSVANLLKCSKSTVTAVVSHSTHKHI